MRLITIYLLLAVFTLSIINKVGFITWFKINQTEFTSLFCINKEKVGSTCQAKCYLKTKLAEAEQKQPTTEKNQQRKLTTEEHLFLHDIGLSYFSKQITTTVEIVYINHYLLHVMNCIFHPPKG